MIKSWSNYQHSPKQTVVEPSITVPGMALPLRTLIDRHTQGVPVRQYVPVYSEDPLLDGYENLNEMEKLDLLEEVTQYVGETKKALQNRFSAGAPATSGKSVIEGQAEGPTLNASGIEAGTDEGGSREKPGPKGTP